MNESAHFLVSLPEHRDPYQQENASAMLDRAEVSAVLGVLMEAFNNMEKLDGQPPTGIWNLIRGLEHIEDKMTDQEDRDLGNTHRIIDGLCKNSIDAWGRESQLRMVGEEAIELGLSVTHWLDRNRDGAAENFLEEAVDSYIMSGVARLEFGKEAWDAMLEKKLKKFVRNLVDKGGQEQLRTTRFYTEQ